MSRILLAVLCLVALLPAAPASASTRNKIIKDCADDGVLQGSYSPADLRDARQHLPSDVAEYTDCADVLRRGEASGTGGGGTGAAGGGSGGGGGTGGPAQAATGVGGSTLIAPATPADHKALSQARVAGEQPVSINGRTVVPGAAGLHTGAPRHTIPGTLVIALVLLAVAGGALAVPAVRRGVPLVLNRLRPTA